MTLVRFWFGSPVVERGEHGGSLTATCRESTKEGVDCKQDEYGEAYAIVPEGYFLSDESLRIATDFFGAQGDDG